MWQADVSIERRVWKKDAMDIAFRADAYNALNSARFADQKCSFIDMDIISDPLPRADAWLCRDVLFHFPFLPKLLRP